MKYALRVLCALIALSSTVALATPVTTHPRLWVRQSDLTRLRSWAVASNPIYENGLKPVAEAAKVLMDNNTVPTQDNGGATSSDYPTEMYAELFAFMSLVENTPSVRDDYAQRARTLLMYVMNIAVLGASPGVPFRDPSFSISDRSRWQGEAWALTVDWIYSYLSSADKTTIRTVFLRWVDENIHADTTTNNHPEPIGVVNDPVLTSDPVLVRWASNNYYDAHMRNIGLMAMSFDAADDSGNTLRDYLGNATGAWLYVIDYLLRHDAAGGLGAEGFEYSPQSLGYVVQFMLALYTAGQDDAGTWGPQVVFSGNPFYGDMIPAYLHSLSPATHSNPNYAEVYQPAWYGACQNYWAPDYIESFGPMGIYDYDTGNAARLQTLRWIETYEAPGGPTELISRAHDDYTFSRAILYFLLFDPAGASPPDPRPSQELTYFSPGLQHILARTDWSPNATWFSYMLSWQMIDHNSANGNHFEFYRNGEWLTKVRTGYDLDYGASDNHNTLSVQNDQPDHMGDWREMLWLRGSQWMYVTAGDPTLVAHSFGSNYVYALGDATNLYNSTYENSTDIQHVSRSIIWLEPDHIVVYDRAVSTTAGRFKRFWLNLPALASVSGNRSTMTTASGQKLFVTTLLPAGSAATITSFLAPDEPSGTPANEEPMTHKLEVQATGGPANVRFLNVLQGADAGSSADSVAYVQSTSGTPFEGAVVQNMAALFPVTLGTPFTSLVYTVPSSVSCQRITGLAPSTSYGVSIQVNGGNQTVTITQPGATTNTDSGGVLSVGNCASPITLSPPSLPNGTINVSYPTQTITASGGTSPYTFSVTSGSLPTGLTLDPSGLLSGTPTAAGAYPFTVTATDSLAAQGSRGYTITINDPSLCLFCDDFEDGVLAGNWSYPKGTWDENSGVLTGSSARKAVAIASPAFAGCSVCTVHATMQTGGGTGNRVWLLGWYTDKSNSVELMMKQESNKWLLKQRAGGVVVAKAKGILPISPGVLYDVEITFDGNQFDVTVDGTPLISVAKGAGSNLSGTVGFEAKATVGTYGDINVN